MEVEGIGQKRFDALQGPAGAGLKKADQPPSSPGEILGRTSFPRFRRRADPV